jgi:GTPase Era involved in 16S rRNA processing
MEPLETGFPAGIDQISLKEYEQRKFAIAEIIRSAQAIDTNNSELLSQARNLLVLLAEDRFNLLMVGRFSRGKSTLMNAILGGEYLPTGIVPLTSVITTVRYGSRKQVVLNFIGSGLSREVPLSQLQEYVTQKENPANVKKLAYAEIQFPVELLRRGLFFVDSPGLGSPIIENSLTTERFLPQADAFVLVTSYESPLSEEEDRILHRIRNTNKKLFVALNKQDMVGPEDRTEAIDFVKDRLRTMSFAEQPQIFSVSARQGLEAKLAQDRDRLAASGVQQFEDALMRFLVEERAQSFLANMYERTMAFLVHASPAQRSAEHEETFRALIDRLHGIREMILGPTGAPQPSALPESNAASAVYPLSLEIDRKTACGVCGTVLDGIFRFLSKYQYELTINPETQQEHAKRGGFCQPHTWQYEGISSPQGVCEAYPKLVYRIASELSELASHVVQQGEAQDSMHSLLPTTKTCRICQTRMELERRGIAEVAARVREAATEEFHAPACCLPHLTMLVQFLGSGSDSQKLIAAHAALLERTAEDLQRYALKHDALRRHLTSEEERRASQLALLLLSGHRNVSSPWTIESII